MMMNMAMRSRGLATRVGPRLGRSFGTWVDVERREEGKIAVVTLKDPKRLNALTADMGDEFVQVVDELSKEGANGLSAVVLTGAGRAFSAGGDLNFLRARSKDTPSRNAVVMRRFYERFLSVRRIPVPVIAAINGPAIGAGLCVALACDLRVAFRDAKMGITFTQIGLHPGMGATHFLPRLIGPQLAAKMMLTGEVISGERAEQMGLVCETFDSPEACVDGAVRLASRIASAGPVAVRTCVRSLRLNHEEGLERALQREADAQAQCYVTGDLSEGVESVAEKRVPNFTQREALQD